MTRGSLGSALDCALSFIRPTALVEEINGVIKSSIKSTGKLCKSAAKTTGEGEARNAPSAPLRSPDHHVGLPRPFAKPHGGGLDADDLQPLPVPGGDSTGQSVRSQELVVLLEKQLHLSTPGTLPCAASPLVKMNSLTTLLVRGQARVEGGGEERLASDAAASLIQSVSPHSPEGLFKLCSGILLHTLL